MSSYLMPVSFPPDRSQSFGDVAWAADATEASNAFNSGKLVEIDSLPAGLRRDGDRDPIPLRLPGAAVELLPLAGCEQPIARKIGQAAGARRIGTGHACTGDLFSLDNVADEVGVASLLSATKRARALSGGGRPLSAVISRATSVLDQGWGNRPSCSSTAVNGSS